MNKENTKKRVAIVGAGAAGMVTAWLLEEEYEVTIFEKENRLGGHAYSVPFGHEDKEVFIEVGAEFFCDQLSPYLKRLLHFLNIPIHYYPLSYTFFNTSSQNALILPPFNLHAWLQDVSLDHIAELLALKKLLDHAADIIACTDTAITIHELCDLCHISQHFRLTFLYPFFAAGWGVRPEELATFAAYDIIQWAFKSLPHGLMPAYWFEIVAGTSSYIKALVGQLRDTTIYTNALIEGIHRKDGKYHIITAEQQAHFDYLIIATNAFTAAELLRFSGPAQDRRTILSTISYFKSTIALHTDKSYMPVNAKNWSPATIRYNGATSALTIHKPWKSPTIFRSWITHDNHLPHGVLAVEEFYHPRVTPAYFSAQDALKKLQGNDNLWIAGFYTTGIDSHDSALASAIAIAQQLSPSSARLAVFHQ